MKSRQVEELIGQRVAVTFSDRHGVEQRAVGVLEAVEYVPLYGASLFVDGVEIPLGRVLRIQTIDQAA